jgi:hypothetical protein
LQLSKAEDVVAKRSLKGTFIMMEEVPWELGRRYRNKAFAPSRALRYPKKTPKQVPNFPIQEDGNFSICSLSAMNSLRLRRGTFSNEEGMLV